LADPFHYLRSQAVTLVYALMYRTGHGYVTGFELGPWWGAVVARAAQFAITMQLAMCAFFAFKGRISFRLAALFAAAFSQTLLFNFWFELGERHLMLLGPLNLLFLCVASDPECRQRTSRADGA